MSMADAYIEFLEKADSPKPFIKSRGLVDLNDLIEATASTNKLVRAIFDQQAEILDKLQMLTNQLDRVTVKIDKIQNLMSKMEMFSLD